MQAICEQATTAVRQHFAYLFSEYGFSFTVCQEADGGAHCFLCLKSTQATIKFEIDYNRPIFYFADASVDCSWKDYGSDAKQWANENILLKFLEQKYPARSVAPPSREPQTLEERLASSARRLRPYVPEILAAFPQSKFPGWWTEFGDFEEQEVQRIRSSFLRKRQ